MTGLAFFRLVLAVGFIFSTTVPALAAGRSVPAHQLEAAQDQNAAQSALEAPGAESGHVDVAIHTASWGGTRQRRVAPTRRLLARVLKPLAPPPLNALQI